MIKKKTAHENMKKQASKVAKPAKIQPKSQFLFHKNKSPTMRLLYNDIQTAFWLKYVEKS